MAGSVPWVDVTIEFDAWRACVVAKADSFSKGPDAADLIVRAAQTACDKEKSRLIQQLDKLDPKKDRLEFIPHSSRSPVVSNAQEAISEEALLRIIEVRATK